MGEGGLKADGTTEAESMGLVFLVAPLSLVPFDDAVQRTFVPVRVQLMLHLPGCRYPSNTVEGKGDGCAKRERRRVSEESYLLVVFQSTS